jgi:SsrA-binding protein
MSAKPTNKASTDLEKNGIKIIVQNRKARHDYEILGFYETGIVLQGTEVKSLRAGKVNLKDSYAAIEKGEVILHSVHISSYEPANRFNHDPERPRKLLLHKGEIRRLIGRSEQRGLTLVPLKIYFKRGRAKVELALARGKKQYDKREAIANREVQRDLERALKDSQ